MLPPFTVPGTDTEVCCILDRFDEVPGPGPVNSYYGEGNNNSTESGNGNDKITDGNGQPTTLPFTGPEWCFIGDANRTDGSLPPIPELFLDGRPQQQYVQKFDINCTLAPTSPVVVTSREEKILVWLPRLFGPLSLMCSLWILVHVARDEKRRQNSYHRLVWAMTALNFVSTIWISLTTLPTPSIYGNRYGSKGNQATCNAQGWFVQLNIGTPLYHASLALYYYLRLCRQWTERDIRKRAEPFIHIFVVGFSLVTATAGIPLKLYNPSLWCWIYALPYGCESSNNNTDDSDNHNHNNDCIRGNHATAYQWGLFYGPLWFMILWMSFMLLMIYLHVRRQEQKTAQYTYNNPNAPSMIRSTAQSPRPRPKNKKPKKKSHARAVASNAAFYVSSFYVVWLGPTVCDMMFDQSHGAVAPFWLYVVSTCMVPLQGFFNFVVYIRPKVVQQYRKHCDKESEQRNVTHSRTGSIQSKIKLVCGNVKSTMIGFWNSIHSNPDKRENADDWKLGTPDAESASTEEDSNNDLNVPVPSIVPVASSTSHSPDTAPTRLPEQRAVTDTDANEDSPKV